MNLHADSANAARLSLADTAEGLWPATQMRGHGLWQTKQMLQKRMWQTTQMRQYDFWQATQMRQDGAWANKWFLANITTKFANQPKLQKIIENL